jgi:calcium-dependent protein kinase
VFLSYNIANPEFKVAIKVLNKQKLGNNVEAIIEEIKTLGALDHPNIVKYYETYDDSKYMYLVMEYCPGGELFDKIAQQKDQAFNEAEACKIIEKLLRAINHCHASHITHRDIKPENIMIGSDGEIKLIDFGLSKQRKGNKQMNTIAGTPYYMAPEVLDGEYN